MTRFARAVVFTALAAFTISGCGGAPHRTNQSRAVSDLSGRIEQVLLVPGTKEKPSVIETQGYALRARIRFEREIRRPERVPQTEYACYIALIDPNSRVLFMDDGSFQVERGAIYVDNDCGTNPAQHSALDDDSPQLLDADTISAEPPLAINAMYLPETSGYVPTSQPTAADDWVWVRTTRAEAGAEGCAIAVQVDDSGYHRVFFLKGKSAFVMVDGKTYRWTDKQRFQEIDVWHTRREKPIAADPAASAWIKGLRARVAAAGLIPF